MGDSGSDNGGLLSGPHIDDSNWNDLIVGRKVCSWVDVWVRASPVHPTAQNTNFSASMPLNGDERRQSSVATKTASQWRWIGTVMKLIKWLTRDSWHEVHSTILWNAWHAELHNQLTKEWLHIINAYYGWWNICSSNGWILKNLVSSVNFRYQDNITQIIQRVITPNACTHNKATWQQFTDSLCSHLNKTICTKNFPFSVVLWYQCQYLGCPLVSTWPVSSMLPQVKQ